MLLYSSIGISNRGMPHAISNRGVLRVQRRDRLGQNFHHALRRKNSTKRSCLQNISSRRGPLLKMGFDGFFRNAVNMRKDFRRTQRSHSACSELLFSQNPLGRRFYPNKFILLHLSISAISLPWQTKLWKKYFREFLRGTKLRCDSMESPAFRCSWTKSRNSSNAGLRMFVPTCKWFLM